jgi:lipoprotein Spr
VPTDFNRYIGIPFRPRGRDWQGADCWGLHRLVVKEELGIELPEYTTYLGCQGPEATRTIMKAIPDWIVVPPRQEKMFDLVLLRKRNLPSHVGTVIGKGWMLHTMEGVAACTQEYNGLVWANRVVGFLRHPSMVDSQ